MRKSPRILTSAELRAAERELIEAAKANSVPDPMIWLVTAPDLGIDRGLGLTQAANSSATSSSRRSSKASGQAEAHSTSASTVGSTFSE